MAAHASVVSTGCYQLPPHAVVVPVGAMQSTQVNQSSGSGQSEASTASPLLPVALGVGIGGALAASAFGIDRLYRSMKAAKEGGLCYRDTAESMVDDQLSYSKDELKATLSRLCAQKFRSEGSRKYNGARMHFSSEGELRAAVQRSVRKSLAHGLSPRKMLRLLNDQVNVLDKKRPDVSSSANSAYAKAYLRPFRIGETLDHDITAINPAELFHCEDVSRFALVYFKTLAAARGSSSREPAHYVMLAHSNGDWRIYDKKNPKRQSHVLHRGAATRIDAKRALTAFAKMQYGTTEHTNMTIFTQSPKYMPRP